MASIPMENETIYTLTDDMRQHILRDAQEHFGDEVRSIRVQSGLQRHAFNARTHAVRYAFSPQDFGLGAMLPTIPETSGHWAAIPTIDDATAPDKDDAEPDLIPAPFKDRTMDEDLESRASSRQSFEAGRDADEEEDVFTLDDPVEEEDEEEEGSILDEEEEDSRSSATWERGTHLLAVTPQSVLDTRALAGATGGVLRKETQEK